MPICRATEPAGGEEGLPMRVVSTVAVVLAALTVGASAQAGARPEQAGVAHATRLLKSVNVAASEFKFVLSAKSAKRGVVIFKVKNVGKVSHDFSVDGRTTKMLAPGTSTTLRVVFLKKGHYPYKCTVPGHAAAGMKGVFTIT
jgi:uncharacterized cupredoxin-like copper-binding protein